MIFEKKLEAHQTMKIEFNIKSWREGWASWGLQGALARLVWPKKRCKGLSQLTYDNRVQYKVLPRGLGSMGPETYTVQ